ncbi:SUKH-4 family immunity protein [Kitasatospora sp. KL5]|uniref:SUKH-4 family immunity protein n=1 Tax=Kitasatospora sp. KL5 TaxID=3425125 RepID=UPI003D6FDE0D
MADPDRTTADRAVREISARLRDDKPGRVYVCGAAGSGKSGVLAALAEEFPDALHLDAAGRSGEQVVRDLLDRTGLQRGPVPGDLGELVRLLGKEKRPRTILLANTHLAGTLVSGGEPRLLQEIVRSLALATAKSKLRLVVEQDEVPELPDARSPRYRAETVVLQGGGTADALRGLESAVPTDVLAALRALAGAQLRRIPVDGWAVLCRAAGVPAAADELRTWAAELPCLVREEDDTVGFADGALAAALRGAGTDRIDTALTDELLGGATLADWAARSLPGHAAAAGRFDDLLADARALARVPREPLTEAFRACYPDGFVRDSRAAALHYLLELVRPGTPHGEWVARLAQDAFARGESERAEELAGACPEPLPFRTVWSHWRPAGDFTAPAVRHRSGLKAVTAASYGGQAVVTTDDAGFRLVRDAAAGELLAGPLAPGTEAPALVPEETGGLRPEWKWSELLDAEGRPAGVLHHPDAERAGAVGDLVVLADRRGAYAVRVDTELLPEGPRGCPSPAVGPPGRVLPRPYDPAAVADLRGLLERTYGPGNVHRLQPDEVPDAVTHAPTRELLTGTGVPFVEGQIGLWLDRVTSRSLAVRPWESVPDNEQPKDSGPFLALGEWMGAPLLLDGATGRVLRMIAADSPDHAHPAEPLAGTTLESFLTMAALQARYADAYRTGGPDRYEVLDELRVWLDGADPDAAGSESWEYVMEPDNW